MAIFVRETFVNETRGYRYGETEWYEAFTDDRGKLFRSLQREYGRCRSKMYREGRNGAPDRVVGWVFEKSMPYEDSKRYGHKLENYLRSVWVEVREQPTA